MYPNLLRNDVRSALGAFLFSGEDVEKKMGQLSGGEKVRLELCNIFYTKPNFLILDEPTNHMDLVGKEALEKMLVNYEGTVLFVSHDRYFIDRVATGIMEFTEDRVNFYPVNYENYLVEREKQGASKQSLTSNSRTDKNEVKPNNAPTLDDVFDKTKYYNPGKILSRLKKQFEKYSEMLAESEEKSANLQMELLNPELSSNYERLMEIQASIDEEARKQESLLERILETELELEEMSRE